jgi:hypothetical protein
MTWEHSLTCREGNEGHWKLYSRGIQQPQRSESVHEAWVSSWHRDRELPDARLTLQFLPLDVPTLVLEQTTMYVSLYLVSAVCKGFQMFVWGKNSRKCWQPRSAMHHSMPPSLWCAQALLSLGDMFLCCSLVCVATFAMRHKMAVKVFGGRVLQIQSRPVWRHSL